MSPEVAGIVVAVAAIIVSVVTAIVGGLVTIMLGVIAWIVNLAVRSLLSIQEAVNELKTGLEVIKKEVDHVREKQEDFCSRMEQMEHSSH